MKREIEEAIVDASQIYPTTYQKPYLDGGIFGYKLAIEKACEWLEEFMQMTPSKKTFIKRFEQAMKGE